MLLNISEKVNKIKYKCAKSLNDYEQLRVTAFVVYSRPEFKSGLTSLIS